MLVGHCVAVETTNNKKRCTSANTARESRVRQPPRIQYYIVVTCGHHGARIENRNCMLRATLGTQVLDFCGFHSCTGSLQEFFDQTDLGHVQGGIDKELFSTRILEGIDTIEVT